MNPADAIPPEWLAVAQSWAPYALGVLALVTVTARPLHVLAWRFQAYASRTSAKWDDNIAGRLVEALAVVVTLTSLLWLFVPRLTVGVPTASAPKAKRGAK